MRCSASISRGERVPSHRHIGTSLLRATMPTSTSVAASARLFALTVKINWTCLVLLIGPAPAILHAQETAQFRLTPRIGAAFHVAGLGLSGIPRPGRPGSGTLWQHRVQPALAYGVTASAPLRRGSIALRVDADLVQRADIRGDSDGPPLIYHATGKSYWTTASVALAPRWLCASRCLSIAAGAGRGLYDYSVGELRGDIANPWAPKQHTTVLRLGLEASARLVGLPLALHVEDYIGTISPAYDQAERLSPVHTLVISGGVILGR